LIADFASAEVSFTPPIAAFLMPSRRFSASLLH